MTNLLSNLTPKWPFFLVLSLNIIAVILAVIAALMLGHSPKYFMDEGQPLTFLSCAQLLFISVLTGIIFYIRKGQYPYQTAWKSPALIWLVLCVGFLFLACDELFSIHEGLDRTIHYQFNIDKTDFTDRLDDLILGLYLGIFCLAVYFGRKELRLYQPIRPLLASAIAITVSMIFLDALSHTTDIITNKTVNEWVNALEDGLKLIAVGFFLSSSYYSLTIAKQLFSHTVKSPITLEQTHEV